MIRRCDQDALTALTIVAPPSATMVCPVKNRLAGALRNAAMARPIPRDHPVTIATFPSSRNGSEDRAVTSTLAPTVGAPFMRLQTWIAVTESGSENRCAQWTAWLDFLRIVLQYYPTGRRFQCQRPGGCNAPVFIRKEQSSKPGSSVNKIRDSAPGRHAMSHGEHEYVG